MSKWKWSAGAIVFIALGTFAALWALTEADVLRWGATATLHDRIEALERQADAPPPAPEWTVLSRQGPVFRPAGGVLTAEACITYTSPAGRQERCEVVGVSGTERTARQSTLSACWDGARIGEPLPDCWR